MRFDPELLEEIKARLPPSQVVGRTVALKRKGREYVALSPFNKERTPSFYVNDEKRFYHCFSSGKHGDIFTWLMETEGLSFPEAVERLAAEAGVLLPEKDPAGAARAAHAAGLAQWLERAAAFFAAELHGKRGAAARAYLEGRGLPGRDWTRFEVGYAPDGWATLTDHLTGKGAAPEALIEAGLAARSDKTGKLFDYFRDRITFAIRDPRGKLAGFGGRALKKDEKAKYLNSPESPLFHKGALLYRYSEARAALARAKGPEAPTGLVVAEGYMDVLALARAGLAHAVAPLGAALTEEQLQLLWKAGGEPLLCFDGDAAGRRAAHRAIDRALPLLGPGRSLRFALLPDGKDPDDLLREQGPAALAAALGEALPLVEMLWRRERDAEPLDTPERRAGLRQRLFEATAAIPEEGLRRLYRDDLLARFDALTRPARAARRAPRPGERAFGPAPGPTAELRANAAALRPAARRRAAARLLAEIVEAPELLTACLESLAALPLEDAEHERLRAALLDVALSDGAVDKSSLRRHLAAAGVEGAAEQVIAEGSLRVLAAAMADAESSLQDATAAWLAAASRLVRAAGESEERQRMRARLEEALAAGDRAGFIRWTRALEALGRTTTAETDVNT